MIATCKVKKHFSRIINLLISDYLHTTARAGRHHTFPSPPPTVFIAAVVIMSWFHTPAPLVTHPPLIVARQSWNQQLLHQQRLRSRRSGSGSCGSLTRPPPCHHLSNMVICFTGFSFTTISVILRLPGRRSCLFTLPLLGTIIKLTLSKIRNRYIS